eukprot:COSAG04_NODE_1381_length_6993_cov_41.974471_2_plen_449_part_00
MAGVGWWVVVAGWGWTGGGGHLAVDGRAQQRLRRQPPRARREQVCVLRHLPRIDVVLELGRALVEEVVVDHGALGVARRRDAARAAVVVAARGVHGLHLVLEVLARRDLRAPAPARLRAEPAAFVAPTRIVSARGKVMLARQPGGDESRALVPRVRARGRRHLRQRHAVQRLTRALHLFQLVQDVGGRNGKALVLDVVERARDAVLHPVVHVQQRVQHGAAVVEQRQQRRRARDVLVGPRVVRADAAAASRDALGRVGRAVGLGERRLGELADGNVVGVVDVGRFADHGLLAPGGAPARPIRAAAGVDHVDRRRQAVEVAGAVAGDGADAAPLRLGGGEPGRDGQREHEAPSGAIEKRCHHPRAPSRLLKRELSRGRPPNPARCAGSLRRQQPSGCSRTSAQLQSKLLACAVYGTVILLRKPPDLVLGKFLVQSSVLGGNGGVPVPVL